MKRALRGRSIHDLNRDYITAGERAEELDLAGDDLDRLHAYRRFIESQGHRIGHFPGALLPVAHAQPQDNPVRADAIKLEENNRGPSGPWLRLLNPPASDPNRALLRVLEGHTAQVHWVTYSPHGRQALSGGYDGTLRLWEVATGQELRRFKGHTDWVRSLTYSPDGRQALSCSADRTLRLWKVSTGQELRRFEGHRAWVLSVTYSPDGRQALSGSADGTVRLWEVVTGHELCRFEGHTRRVTTVTYSPHGRQALSGSDDKTLRLWDVEHGKVLTVFPCDETPTSVAIRDQTVVVGDAAGKVRFFRLEE